MTIPFYGAPTDLFNALGTMGQVVKQQYSNLQTQNTNLTNPSTGVLGQLIDQADIQALIGDNYVSVLAGLEGAGSLMQTLAQLYLNRLVFQDNPQPGQDMQSVNLPASIAELIRQMKLNGQTVLAMTITLTPGAPFANQILSVVPGNGVLVGSARRPLDGLVLENAFTETLQITCTADSYSGGQTKFNESFSVTGENGQADVFAYNWPLGSGCAATLQAIDGDTSNGSGNLLTNSGFAAFTANVPNNWTLTVGTAGVNCFQETTLIYSGASALRLTGDASSTLTALTQQFSSSTGTTATLQTQTEYGFNIFLRCGGTVPAQGVLQIDLIDGSANIVNDANNSPNSFTIDLTKLTTVYTAYSFAVRTPVVLPATYSLRMHLTTSLPNNVSVYLGKGSLGLQTQLYVSGPFLSLHSGNQPAVVGDYTTYAVANSRGVAGTLSTWQTLFNQLMGNLMLQAEFLLPSSSVPSIPDSAIT